MLLCGVVREGVVGGDKKTVEQLWDARMIMIMVILITNRVRIGRMMININHNNSSNVTKKVYYDNNNNYGDRIII